MKNFLHNIRQFRLLALVFSLLFLASGVALAQAPTISSFTETGAIGSDIEINGTGLSGTYEVHFGSTVVTAPFVSVTATKVVVTVPATATIGNLTVKASGGQTTTTSAFTPYVTWNGGNGNWDVPSNWGNNAIPTATTNVMITSGSPVINSVAYCNDLTLSIGVTLNLNTTADLTIGGLFVKNGNFTQTSGMVTLKGAFSNQGGTFSQTGGTINFAAPTGDQFLPALTYKNLMISGGGTKYLQGSATVETSLIFTGSNLTMVNLSHVLTLNGTISGEDNNHSFIGKLVKTRPVTGVITDNFGNIGVGFSNTGGGNWGNVTATRVTGQFISTAKGKSINRIWTITPTNPGANSAVVLTLTWLEAETNGLTFPNSEAQAWRKEDNTEWLPVDGLKAIASNNNERSITVNTNTFSTWAITDQLNPLPVTMTSFTGKATAAGSVLNWVTASEKNTASFEIERSANGKEFETIGSVKAGGNSNNTLKYVFTDRNATNKVGYYRLRMVDMDGTFEYSSIVTITNTKATDMSVVAYPNPFNESLNLKVSTAVSKAEVVINTVDGKEVYRQTINEGSPVTNLTLTNLPKMKAGFYLLNLIVDGKATVLKVAQQ